MARTARPGGRRSRTFFAATLVGSLAGGAFVRAADDRMDARRAEVAARGDLPPGADANGPRAERVGAQATADLDGDGRADRTWVVRWRHDPAAAFVGVRAELTRHGRRTAWWPLVDSLSDPRIDGFADVDGNGSREVVMSMDAQGDARLYTLVQLTGDRLAVVRGLGLTTAKLDYGTASWGCEGGRVYAAALSTSAGRRDGVVSYYRLRGHQLVEEGKETHTVPRGAPVPPIYDGTARCDGLVAPSPSAAPVPGAGAGTPSPSPEPGATEVPDSAVRGDVDGDGRADTVTPVESGERAEETWRYGVRVAATSAGVSVAWAEPGEGGNDAQRLDGVADVDGDGRGEVAIARGTTVGATSYALVTLHRGRARFVGGAAELWVGRHDGSRGWGCRDGLVYATTARRAAGTVAWYRLAGDRLVHVRTDTRRWRAGTTPPAPFGERISCGAFRAP